MLDELKCREKFIEYVNRFDKSNRLISLKFEHTFRVADISKDIAKSLGLDEEQIKLAYIIGILHDIGRFKQATENNCYSDKQGIGHAKMGDIILFEENMIEEFVDTRIYDDVIRTSIRNHSKFEIEDGLTEEELLFSKIIRDADKLDIFNIFTFDDLLEVAKGSGFSDSDEVTDVVLDAFFKGKQVPRKEHKYLLDWYINMIGFVFDLNFKRSFEVLKNENYINRCIDKLREIKSDKPEILFLMDKVQVFMEEYINNRI